ncbi:TetR/AcrR family transcriptional regulator [Baekduia alba]|uniref:TetR/AcrR family transcriptional regulator n=1 Tax=Baekduia alba TaxID=2997333 RepID=UPI002341F9E6|nr:TetR/AcrR family transcriptional regulator [Baekduia alba]
MEAEIVGRRARLRAQTTAEIKAIALQLMAQGGPDAISLRAIAREMGMSGSAIYSYFATRDDLVTTLIADLYTSLVDQVEAARDAVGAEDVAGRIIAWGTAMRAWSLANPEGFRLIYGDPVRGYQPPASGPAPDAAKRACVGLVEIVASAWPFAKDLQPNDDHQWSDFSPGLATTVRERFPALPPAAVALALRVWGRTQGLLSLEIYGHLGLHTSKPGAVYHDEMLDLVRSLGVAAP